jgi:acyl carrier protein
MASDRSSGTTMDALTGAAPPPLHDRVLEGSVTDGVAIADIRPAGRQGRPTDIRATQGAPRGSAIARGPAMIRAWISAAAAAGSLSEAPAHTGPLSERARIIGIAGEVRRLVARFADVETKAIVAPRALRDLGVDELALADLVLGLEARFDIDIDDADAARWDTVGDVVAFVARRSREAPTAGAFTAHDA